jgi:hypothetical protein
MRPEDPSLPTEPINHEVLSPQQTTQARWRYFAEIVTDVRVGGALLSEKEHRALVESRQHNQHLRNRTADRVAGGIALSGRMPRYPGLS